ncbi:hypothetical protein B7463_g9561, partial [Scytalidium lignicola]
MKACVVIRDEDLQVIAKEEKIRRQDVMASFMEIFHDDNEKIDKMNKILLEKAGFEKCYSISTQTQTYTRKVNLQVINALAAFGATVGRITSDIRHLTSSSTGFSCTRTSRTSRSHGSSQATWTRCKICYCDSIPTWVSNGHQIALLNDSCHAHLPTSAQGASQATERAVVLAVCLKLAGKENIPLASQLNGEDVRDRWHNCLKNLDEGVKIEPETVKIKAAGILDTVTSFEISPPNTMPSTIAGGITGYDIVMALGNSFPAQNRQAQAKAIGKATAGTWHKSLNREKAGLQPPNPGKGQRASEGQLAMLVRVSLCGVASHSQLAIATPGRKVPCEAPFRSAALRLPFDAPSPHNLALGLHSPRASVADPMYSTAQHTGSVIPQYHGEHRHRC